MIRSDPAITCVILEIDDAFFFGDTFDKMLGQLRLFLKLCRRRNIKLSPKKINTKTILAGTPELLKPSKKKHELPGGGR